jgi:hypothetical protein
MNAAFTTALMMLIHTIHGTFVGGDLSRTPPVMAPKTIHATPVLFRQASYDQKKCRGIPRGCPVHNHRFKLDRVVGADLSRTSPIYRLASFHHNTLFASKHWSSNPTEGNP